MKITDEAEKIMEERFGRDTVIALATVEGDMPCVRYVNAFYENGAFYVITHGLSNKMRQLKENPQAAIAGEWFTAHGLGIDLGYWGEPGNAEIAEKLRQAFLRGLITDIMIFRMKIRVSSRSAWKAVFYFQTERGMTLILRDGRLI